MKLQILGTGAAEGMPAVFCECAVCKNARKLGGKNIRSRSGSLINDTYKIDFSPDSYYHSLQHGLSWGEVEHLFLTHSHRDHFYPGEFHLRKEKYAHPNKEGGEKRPLHIYGDSWVHDCLKRDVPDYEEGGIEFHELRVFEPVTAGSMTAIPLKANHMDWVHAHIYLFSEGEKYLLYAIDTGWFPEETWEFLGTCPKLHCAVIDSTRGMTSGRPGHMGIPEVIETKRKLEEMVLLNTKSKVIANHFSHNAGLMHHELEEIYRPHNITVAFDGMAVSF